MMNKSMQKLQWCLPIVIWPTSNCGPNIMMKSLLDCDAFIDAQVHLLTRQVDYHIHSQFDKPSVKATIFHSMTPCDNMSAL